MLDLLCFQWQNLGSKGAKEFETLHVANHLIPLCVCQISCKSNKFQGKRSNEEKSGQLKKHKFHEMLYLLCFQWQNLGSKGASEVENLHVPNQKFPLCVCQKSSKSNTFEGERASEAKNGKTKNPKFHEMLDLLCFRWQNLESKGA